MQVKFLASVMNLRKINKDANRYITMSLSSTLQPIALEFAEKAVNMDIQKWDDQEVERYEIIELVKYIVAEINEDLLVFHPVFYEYLLNVHLQFEPARISNENIPLVINALQMHKEKNVDLKILVNQICESLIEEFNLGNINGLNKDSLFALYKELLILKKEFTDENINNFFGQIYHLFFKDNPKPKKYSDLINLLEKRFNKKFKILISEFGLGNQMYNNYLIWADRKGFLRQRH